MKWRRWRTLYVGLVIAVAIVVFARSRWPMGRAGMTYSRETTYLLGPVEEDGTVNYCAAFDEMLSEGVTPETNAAIPMVKALGPRMVFGKSREQVLERLGFADLPEEGDCLPRLGREVIPEYVKENPTEEELARPEETEESRKVDEALDRSLARLMKGGVVRVDPEQSKLFSKKRAPIRRDLASKREQAIFERVTTSPWSAEDYPFLVDFLSEQANGCR